MIHIWNNEIYTTNPAQCGIEMAKLKFTNGINVYDLCIPNHPCVSFHIHLSCVFTYITCMYLVCDWRRLSFFKRLLIMLWRGYDFILFLRKSHFFTPSNDAVIDWHILLKRFSHISFHFTFVLLLISIFFRLFISLFHSFCVLLACVCISTRVFLTITLLILFYFYFHWMIFCCITSKMWTYCCEFWSLQSKSSSDVWVCVRTQHMILIFYFQSFHLALRCCRYVKKTFSV